MRISPGTSNNTHRILRTALLSIRVKTRHDRHNPTTRQKNPHPVQIHQLDISHQPLLQENQPLRIKHRQTPQRTLHPHLRPSQLTSQCTHTSRSISQQTPNCSLISNHIPHSTTTRHSLPRNRNPLSRRFRLRNNRIRCRNLNTNPRQLLLNRRSDEIAPVPTHRVYPLRHTLTQHNRYPDTPKTRPSHPSIPLSDACYWCHSPTGPVHQQPIPDAQKPKIKKIKGRTAKGGSREGWGMDGCVRAAILGAGFARARREGGRGVVPRCCTRIPPTCCGSHLCYGRAFVTHDFKSPYINGLSVIVMGLDILWRDVLGS